MKRLARTDISIQTRELFWQAIWCGLVFGLACVITTLNLLPPVDVQYLVSGKLVATPSSAKKIQENLGRSESFDQPTQLRTVEILDSATQLTKFQGYPQTVLLNVESIWQNRCDASQFSNWIESMARTSHLSIVQSTDETRITQWELNATKHYQEHLDYVNPDQQPSSPDGKVFQLASTPNHLPTSQQIRQQLAEKAQQLESQLDQLNQPEKEAGLTAGTVVELTDDLIVRPTGYRIPAWMAFSVLVLGTCAGATAGWLNLRLQSGGVHDASDVAELLSRQTVPIAGVVVLSDDSSLDEGWISQAAKRASHAGRTSGRHLITISEIILAGWCLFIVVRFGFDSTWRHLLLDNPLAALGRLVVGMP